jgi:hypothetical protein
MAIKNNESSKKYLRRVPEQFIRLSIVIIILVAAVVLIRIYAVPSELKESQIRRDKTIQVEISRKGSYSETEVCAECHDEQELQKKSGFHKFLACETCHGPGQAHTEDPGEKSPSAPKDRGYCALCHAYDPARPTGFPQINTVAHNPMKACISCHDPHAPKPPEVPKECSACHGEISRTMSVSPHVQLECTNCHKVPAQHKTAPHTARPSKPENREFCGKCHAKDKGLKSVPRVDIVTHGEKYLCWQCHYPHMPEAS